jgi:hypothetical protein
LDGFDVQAAEHPRLGVRKSSSQVKAIIGSNSIYLVSYLILQEVLATL